MAIGLGAGCLRLPAVLQAKADFHPAKVYALGLLTMNLPRGDVSEPMTQARTTTA